jgi:hypothetical protein
VATCGSNVIGSMLFSSPGSAEDRADGVVLFTALHLASRRSIAIPKSAQFVLTVCSNAALPVLRCVQMIKLGTSAVL